MIDPILAQARALRLLLAALESDEAGSIDGMSRVIGEADGCSDSLIEIILHLTDMLTQPINHSQRRDWIIYLSLRLTKLLDKLGAAT